MVEVTSMDGIPENELIRLAAMAEKYSEHPVGRAIVNIAAERGINVEDPGAFQTFSGLGVMVKSEGHEVLLGRLKAMTDNNVTVDQTPYKLK